MKALQDKLKTASEKVDLRIDDIWNKAEEILKKLKDDFYLHNTSDTKSNKHRANVSK